MSMSMTKHSLRLKTLKDPFPLADIENFVSLVQQYR